MLFMVFCCCSTDIILNRFPGWEKWSFSLHNYDRTSLQTACDLKRVLYTPDQFASRQNYSGSSSGFPSVRAHLPVTLVIVGCKRASIRNLFVIRPQTIALCIRIRQNSGLQHLIRRIANPVHDMCGRECRLLNILKIMGFWFSSKTPTSING
jgi:hypothetical protein